MKFFCVLSAMTAFVHNKTFIICFLAYFIMTYICCRMLLAD